MISYEPGGFNIPEGHYVFKIKDEPERRKKTSQAGNPYIYYIFKFVATDMAGDDRDFSDVFVRFDDRLGDLLIAVGGKAGDDGKIHMEEVDLIGRQFEGDVALEENPNKPGEKKSKIVNIVSLLDVPQPNESDKEDGIPF